MDKKLQKAIAKRCKELLIEMTGSPEWTEETHSDDTDNVATMIAEEFGISLSDATYYADLPR